MTASHKGIQVQVISSGRFRLNDHVITGNFIRGPEEYRVYLPQ